MIPQKQLSLADIFKDCQKIFDSHVDITEPICQSIDDSYALYNPDSLNFSNL